LRNQTRFFKQVFFNNCPKNPQKQNEKSMRAKEKTSRNIRQQLPRKWNSEIYTKIWKRRA